LFSNNYDNEVEAITQSDYSSSSIRANKPAFWSNGCDDPVALLLTACIEMNFA
jgi:hypothetical protein